jgi:hypothetical protein
MRRIIIPLRGNDLIRRRPILYPRHHRKQDVMLRIHEARRAVDGGAKEAGLVRTGYVPGRVLIWWSAGAVSRRMGSVMDRERNDILDRRGDLLHSWNQEEAVEIVQLDTLRL